MLDKIKQIIEPILKEEGVELVEMVYRREAGRMVLRLLIDREGGIRLGDCAQLNQRLSMVMDEADTITERYVLEVDSPGIDRPFKIKRDYERAKGRLVRVMLSEAVADKREHIGTLEEILEDSIKVDTNKKGIIEIPFDKITRARQEVDI
ncbi:MAG: ribosome maturation factor RimP [Candidatus Omnitrophica bacterium]|nr:ribosome maturation factor RimP [Candidatus Omnitrophota bacterium]